MATKTALLTILSTCLVLATVPASATADDPAAATPLSSLDVGDIVAVGETTDKGCNFAEPVLVSVTPEANFTGTVTSSLKVDGECRVHLTHVSTEHGQQGGEPSTAVSTAGVGLGTIPELGGGASAGTSAGVLSSETVNNRVYHYGTGGHDDMLTQVTDEVTFTYDGSSATIVSDEQVTCSATGSWQIDDCVEDVMGSPGDPAYKKSHGDFHRDPWWSSPGYYHTLRSYTGGYGDGRDYCVYGWDGTIASGVSNDCTVS